MTAKPQFDHKSPGICRIVGGVAGALRAGLATSYNAAVVAPAGRAVGTDVRFPQNDLGFPQ
jgi:hypothetical protein